MISIEARKPRGIPTLVWRWFFTSGDCHVCFDSNPGIDLAWDTPTNFPLEPGVHRVEFGHVLGRVLAKHGCVTVTVPGRERVVMRARCLLWFLPPRIAIHGAGADADEAGVRC